MLRVLLIEDESLALKMLKNLLSTYDTVEIVGTFTEYQQIIDKIDLSEIHAVFINIELVDAHTIDVGDMLKKQYRDMDIVFVTAYEQYLLKAFEVEATDYLLKPFSKQRLDQTIERLCYNHALEQSSRSKKI